jgi:hypothetical protein
MFFQLLSDLAIRDVGWIKVNGRIGPQCEFFEGQGYTSVTSVQLLVGKQIADVDKLGGIVLLCYISFVDTNSLTSLVDTNSL